MNSEVNRKSQQSFTRSESTPLLGTTRGIPRAIYTLRFPPPHDRLHGIVAVRAQGNFGPLQPPIRELADQIQTVTADLADPTKLRRMKGRELTKLAGVLIQFTDYVPTLQPYTQTPYDHIKSIYDDFTDMAARKGRPLTFTDQMSIALQQTEGDLTEALWRLFLTSRFYGRWLDGKAISNLPSFETDEKLDMMYEWQQSLAACKAGGESQHQDVAGDTYYAWTHALATVAYDALPQKPSRRTELAKQVFENGTELMHSIIHKRQPQTVESSHRNAAEYGNAIGRVCADILSQEDPQPINYQLVLDKPLIDKVLPGGYHVSRFLSRPLRPAIDYLLMHKPTSAPNNNPPNDEVFRGYEENWLSFGVRTAANLRDRPRKVENIDDNSFSSFSSRELKSGVTKIKTRLQGEKVTAFIAPPRFVPYSFRTMDILPDREGQVAVSATLRKIAKTAETLEEFPAIAMTSAGLNRMVIFSDAVYVKPLDGKPVEEHVRRHIDETTVGIDTRYGAPYFTFDDFFFTLNNPHPHGGTDRTTNAPYLPGSDAYWLVTRTDGSMQAMSASELRAADEQRGFRNTIASICSTTAFVNETIADEYTNRTDLPVQLANAVVLFSLDGERRIGSVHSSIDANAITIYELAKYVITNQFPGAENIEVGVIDGGGSLGAIVQKKKNWKGNHRFDHSSLSMRALEHEIPVFTGLVPEEFVTKL